MENFRFNSSFADDVRHEQKSPYAYEWWYFDAVSDDGRDALVIIFLDNFVFSPNYNKQIRQNLKKGSAAKTNKLFPAIALTFYRDGKPLCRAINQFAESSFYASTEEPQCRIGASSFEFEETPYGARYILRIEANLANGKKIRAAFEWLPVEGDFEPRRNSSDEAAHYWNLVAPRCDVTGKMKIIDGKNKVRNVEQFRGTGYHDHNFDTRPLPFTVIEWQWGRAHFSNVTAVFYRYLEYGAKEAVTQLFIVENEKLSVYRAIYAEKNARRNIFGIRYPQELLFESADGAKIKLKVNQTKVLDASFFYLRMLGEAHLTTSDGALHQAEILSEHLAPKTLQRGFFDFLIQMRIGSPEKGAFLS